MGIEMSNLEKILLDKAKAELDKDIKVVRGHIEALIKKHFKPVKVSKGATGYICDIKLKDDMEVFLHSALTTPKVEYFAGDYVSYNPSYPYYTLPDRIAKLLIQGAAQDLIDAIWEVKDETV